MNLLPGSHSLAHGGLTLLTSIPLTEAESKNGDETLFWTESYAFQVSLGPLPLLVVKP